MGSPCLKCDYCGSNNSRKLIADSDLIGLRCEKCFQGLTINVPYPKFTNPYHKGLSEAKERVFKQSYFDKDSGDVFDRDTKKPAAY